MTPAQAAYGLDDRNGQIPRSEGPIRAPTTNPKMGRSRIIARVDSTKIRTSLARGR